MLFTAAILVETGRALVVDSVKLNKLHSSQVIVKVHRSGICRSQLYEVDGKRGVDKYLPHLLGHEAVGTVVETGTDTTSVKAGDKVILTWIRGSGLQGALPDLSWNNQKLNAGHVTTFSDYTVVSENRLFKSAEAYSHPLGPMFGCAIPTGYSIALTETILSTAKYVAVVGLGGIGMFAIQGLLSNSNAIVIGVDLEPSRLSFAKVLGSHYTINGSKESVKDKIHDYTNGQLCDLVIECTGSASATSQALEYINNQGLVKFLSHPPLGDYLNINPFDLIQGKRIEGSWAGGSRPEIHFPHILKEISPECSISQEYPSNIYSLSEINQALADLRAQKVLRPVIQF